MKARGWYNNPEDWDDDWVFGDPRFGLARGSDDVFLRFLAETLHPVVRADPVEARRLAKVFNDALALDGWELVPDGAISGRPVYRARRRTSFHGGLPELKLDTRPLLTDPVVLHEHLGRIRDGIERDPAAAIASCKELVESLLKMILDKSAVAYTKNDNIPKLYAQVAALLALKAESVPASAKGSEASHKVLGTLAQTVNSLAELRNQLGLGHGRTTPSPALARHARLALNATVTVAEFLLDTWHERVDKGLLTPTPMKRREREPTTSHGQHHLHTPEESPRTAHRNARAHAVRIRKAHRPRRRH
ncbi:abortive infection family protein [Embleya sp. NPDC050154]|uniref:abortive infection family protein n=1 Tax=Embleya sp. NPDC050154 TaxID=3363988 RepID=UPI003790F28A